MPLCRSITMRFSAAIGLTLAVTAVALAQDAVSDDWERRIDTLVQQGELAEATRLAETARHEASTAASAHGWLGRISMAGARFGEADARFARARDLGASVVEFADPWSRALVRLDRRKEACSLLADAASLDEENASLRFLAGSCYLRLGSPGDALPHLEAADRYGIRHSAAAIDLARARIGSGREELAVDQLLEMTEQISDPSTLLTIGKTLFQSVLYRQALIPLAKATELRSKWYDAAMYQALCHYQLEQYQECADILSTLDLESSRAELRLLLGSALARLGMSVAARRELEAGIELAPERADGHLNLGLYFLDRGEREQALDLFDQAAARDARGAKVLYHVKSRSNCLGLSPPSQARAVDAPRSRYLIEFADSLLIGQQWGAALEVYLTALWIDPRPARPYGGIGLICQELGTAKVGVEFVQRGLQLHPSDAELHYYLGSLYEYLSEPVAAIESYRQALAHSDSETAPGRYWLRLGLAQLATGEVEQAESSFQIALQREPELAEAHYRLGKLRFRTGQYGEAEQFFEQAVRLDPALAEAYYSWGLACVRNGKRQKGREILESHRRKTALRQSQAGGMQ